MRSQLILGVICTLLCMMSACSSGENGTGTLPDGRPVVSAVSPSTGVIGHEGQPVQFQADAAGIVTAWQWNFGDGALPATSTDAMPVVLLRSPGTYEGTVIATNAAGNSEPAAFSYTVVAADVTGDAPTIFDVIPTGSAGVSGDVVTFKAIADGAPTAWDWSFGSGAAPDTSVDQMPLGTLGPAASYTGSVTATNRFGTSAPFAFTFEVEAPLAPPTITAISPAGGIIGSPGQQVAFEATATGTATGWSWDFGGGATPNSSTAPITVITLGATGQYAGQVIASNAAGSSAPFAFTYEISTAPTIPVVSAVDPADLVAAINTTQRFTAMVSGSAPYTWLWDFGGGRTPNESTEAEPLARFDVRGTFAGTVTVSNAVGNSLPFHFTYQVVDVPSILQVQPSNGLVGSIDDQVTFRATFLNDLPTTYHWEFGAGVSPPSSAETIPTRKLLADGHFQASLVVSNIAGDSALFPFTYDVLTIPTLGEVLPAPNPTRHFELESVVPFSVELLAGTATQYEWEFPAESGCTPLTSTDAAPMITMGTTQVGDYVGQVRAGNDLGFSQWVTFPFHIAPHAPVISPFGALDQPTSFVLPWHATVSADATEIVWDFGGGATADNPTGSTVTVTYGAAGTYTGFIEASNETGIDHQDFDYTVLPGGEPGWSRRSIAPSNGTSTPQMLIVNGLPAIAWTNFGGSPDLVYYARALTVDPLGPSDWQVHDIAPTGFSALLTLNAYHNRPVLVFNRLDKKTLSIAQALTDTPAAATDYRVSDLLVEGSAQTRYSTAAVLNDRIAVGLGNGGGGIKLLQATVDEPSGPAD
ncbi:MAG: PKD domain-containing protein, partial [bacterium]